MSTCHYAWFHDFRSTPEFPNYLGIVLSTMLSYTNDKESDVRMMADECLNRITKVRILLSYFFQSVAMCFFIIHGLSVCMYLDPTIFALTGNDKAVILMMMTGKIFVDCWVSLF